MAISYLNVVCASIANIANSIAPLFQVNLACAVVEKWLVSGLSFKVAMNFHLQIKIILCTFIFQQLLTVQHVERHGVPWIRAIEGGSFE